MSGFAPRCGPACPMRDWVSGVCERHGPTEADMIVKRVTDGFRADLRSIMSDNRAALNEQPRTSEGE